MARRRSRDDLDTLSIAQAFQEIRADYNAAKTSRFKRIRAGVSAAGTMADYHYRTEADYLRMLEYARDLDRNDTVLGQGITRLQRNVVGGGYALSPQTGDEGLDEALSERWRDWAEDPDQCDHAGEHDWHALEGLTFRGLVVDGDTVGLLLRSGALQCVESHRIRTPANARRRKKDQVVHGFLLDSRRRRKEVWITKEDIDPNAPLYRVGDMDRKPIRDREGFRQVLHLYNPKRLSQTRGVTALAPICDMAGMHDDLQFAQLVAAQIQSCYAILVEQGPQPPGGTQPATGEASTESLTDGSTRQIQGVAPGMRVTGKPGQQLKGFSPTVPHSQFFNHATLILTILAINLDLPLAVLLLDPSNTNFSGWRGAMDQARMGFQELQRLHIARVHRPTYRFKVRQWISEDPSLRAAAERSDVKIYRHLWQPPGWPYIEPLTDRQAELLSVRNALTSQRRRCRERGHEWHDLVDEIVADNVLLIESAHKAAAELNKRYPAQGDRPGLNVTWREIAMLPTPDGVTVSVQGDEDIWPDKQQDKNEGQNGKSGAKPDDK